MHFCGYLEDEPYEIPENSDYDTIKDIHAGTIKENDKYKVSQYESDIKEYKATNIGTYQLLGTESSTLETSLNESVSVSHMLAQSSDWHSDSFDRSRPAAYMADVTELFFL